MSKAKRRRLLDDLIERFRTTVKPAAPDSAAHGTVVVKRNVAVTASVGREGSTEVAASQQIAPIRQKGRS